MYKHLFLLISILFSLSSPCVHAERYYFQHLGLKNKLSQSSVLCITQDRNGFMWFGTKDGLNRYDGSNFRIFKHNHSNPHSLGNNNVNSLHENKDGKLWIGTDDGIYIYDPLTETFSKLTCKSQDSLCITQPIVQITTDTQKNIWIAVESQGVFLFDNDRQTLTHYAIPDAHLLSSICIDQQNAVWIGYNGKGLYYTDDHFQNFRLFQTQEGKNLFTDDQIFKIFPEQHNTLYTGSAKGGLKSINILTRTVTDLLPDSSQTESIFVRNIYPIDKKTLWVATERGIYTYNKETREIQHLTYNPNDDYSLSDNAIYSLCCDKENGMWIGSYFGGVNYCPYQWTYFEKFYPRDNLRHFGRRVREICESNDGTLWIGTEDKGLFNYNPENGKIEPFEHPAIYQNVHGLCLDGDDLWVGTFSGGLNRVNLRTRQVKHYAKGESENSMVANDAFTICRTTTGDVWIGTTSGLLKYNRSTDDFTRIPQLKNMFTYNILEDFNGNLWFATFSNGVFCYNVRSQQWRNYLSNENDSTSLPYNKVISIYEDSRKRLWFHDAG